MGWGWGLIGVAAIILGEGVVRWIKGLRIHGFSIAMGLMLPGGLAGPVWLSSTLNSEPAFEAFIGGEKGPPKEAFRNAKRLAFS